MALDGRYKLLAKLGEGASGTIYRALDNTLGNEVSIKFLKYYSRPEEIIRFQRCARASARLRHPRLIQIRDFGVSENDGPYLTAEFIPGDSLSQYVAERGFLELEPALQIFFQILDGVSYAHSEMVIHRDLKPGNIVLSTGADDSVEATIIDFGLAVLRDEDVRLTGSGKILGTPLYMSPEQLKSKSVSTSCDIYALGCILFFMLGGRAIFSDASGIELVELKNSIDEIEDQLESLSAETRLDARIVPILRKCLAPNVEDRYQCVEEILRELRAVSEQILSEERGYSYENIIEPGAASLRQSFSSPIFGIALVFFLTASVISFSIYSLNQSRKYQNTPSGSVSVNKPAASNLNPGDFSSPEYSPLSQAEEDLGANIEVSKMNSEGETSIQVQGPVPLESALEAIAKAENLVQLSLRSTACPKSLLDAIRKRDFKLRFLKLEAVFIDDATFETIERMPTLTVVELLDSPDLTPSSLHVLSRLPRLRVLKLSGTHLKEDILPFVCQFESLEWLSLGRMKIGAEQIEQLQNLKRLDALHLSACTISESGYAGLGRLEQLNRLELKNLSEPLTKRRIIPLAGLDHLKVLRFGSLVFEPGVIRYLSKNKTLELLELENVEGIDAADLSILRRSLPNCSIE